MMRPLNLKAKQWLSLVIWALGFICTGLSTFAFAGKYYGPVWSSSMMVIFLPHFYWGYMSVKLCETVAGKSNRILFFKTLFVIAMIALCTMLFGFSLPVQLESKNLEAILSLGSILFFGSIFTCFIFGARALVSTERQVFKTSPNMFLAFLIFVYLPIGIFFLVPRLQKLHQSHAREFD